jgi:hypothetical protein
MNANEIISAMADLAHTMEHDLELAHELWRLVHGTTPVPGGPLTPGYAMVAAINALKDRDIVPLEALTVESNRRIEAEKALLGIANIVELWHSGNPLAVDIVKAVDALKQSLLSVTAEASTNDEVARLLEKQRDAALERVAYLNEALEEARSSNETLRARVDTLTGERHRLIGNFESMQGFVRDGEALRNLDNQLTRLMNTPCPTMKFGFGREATGMAVISEVLEVLSEDGNSNEAKKECAGLLAVAIRMARIHGVDPAQAAASEAKRIKNRLDIMERHGCTWADAKTIEALAGKGAEP